MKEKSKLNTKLVLINGYILCIILILISTGIIVFIHNTYKNNIQNQLKVTTSNITYNINQSIQSMKQVSLQLSFNDHLIELMKEIDPLDKSSNYFSRELLLRTKFSRLALSYVVPQQAITRVIVFNDYSDYLYAGNIVAYDYNQKLLLSYANRYDHIFRNPILHHMEVQSVDLLNPEDTSQYFVFTRPIIDYFSQHSKKIGYVQLWMPLITLCSGLTNLPDTYEGYIVNHKSKDTILFSTSNTGKGTLDSTAVNEIKKVRNKYISRSAIQDTPFSIVLIYRDTHSFIFSFLSLLITVLLILAILLITYHVQSNALRKILTPLRELSKNIEEQELHLKKTILHIDSNEDELVKINTAFNSILNNLYESFDQTLIAKRNEMNSYIYTLRSQMDPHFIHNTLTVIESLSYEGQNRKIEQMCEKLSSIIRYNSSVKGNTSTLLQEITSGRNYLELMDIRYEKHLIWSIDCNRLTEDLKIPQFVLQPLIENAFIHGLKYVEFPWCITIEALSNEHSWQISISDNGKGVDKTTLSKISQSIHRIKEKSLSEVIYELEIGGLTLTNIFVRLYETYGENTIFTIKNKPKGCTITIGGSTKN